MFKMLAFPVVVLLLMSPSVNAQSLMQADMAILQPQINRDDRGFVSCGVRAIVIQHLSGKNFEAYDFSINANANIPYGTLKAGKSRVSSEQIEKGKPKRKVELPAPVYFWIAQESDPEALKPIKVFPSEDAGYVLEFADLVKTFAAIYSTINGERMQFSVRYKKQRLDSVISFSAQMPMHEQTPLIACMDGLTNRLAAEYATTK